MLLALVVAATPVGAAEPSTYPFEGTWIRADRTCAATTVRARLYTAKEVVSPRGRCAIRRIVSGSGVFELQEDCRRNDRSGAVTEIIRMTSADSLTLKRQLNRLKIPRQVHYTRCSIAAAQPQATTRVAKPATVPADGRNRDSDTE